MADIDVDVRWEGSGLEFVARGRSGQDVRIDGNSATSASPVEMVLMSLATCMGADILDIGGRMRLPITTLTMRASGMRNAEPPRRYLSMRVAFTVGGVSDEDAPKLERALELSQEKYCSVLHTLRQDMDIEFELLRIAGTANSEGPA